jgi:hypothetical protein
MSSRPQIVLDAALRMLLPLVRLLLRNGVGYPAFVAALKPVFLQAANSELAARRMAATDSALTLLSGVHRRDVRRLTRLQAALPDDGADSSLSLAAQVVARWMSVPACTDANGEPKPLERSAAFDTFDTLVASVSRDVRPRAMLDELLRLGAVDEVDGTVVLRSAGFAPRQGFAEMSQLMADNLRDHTAAAAANLQGDANFLEQAMFVDQISAESAERLQRVAVLAWQQAFRSVMHEAQERFDADATGASASARSHRARFGVYFFSERETPK